MIQQQFSLVLKLKERPKTDSVNMFRREIKIFIENHKKSEIKEHPFFQPSVSLYYQNY